MPQKRLPFSGFNLREVNSCDIDSGVHKSDMFAFAEGFRMLGKQLMCRAFPEMRSGTDLFNHGRAGAIISPKRVADADQKNAHRRT